MAGNRVVVHVAGIHAGQVDIDVDPEFLSPLPYDADGPIIPDNFCGLRIRKIGGFLWEDEQGNLVEAENHGEVEWKNGDYYLVAPGSPDVEFGDAYLGGIEFTGPIVKYEPIEDFTVCSDGGSWYFPIPLSFGGNGPQFGSARLIIQLDGASDRIEFIDHNADPVEIPDLFDDWEEIPNFEEWLEQLCEEVPEFCEEDEDEDDSVDVNSVLDGISDDIQMNPDPIVDPPKFGNLKLVELEPNAIAAVDFLRADLVHFKALKTLMDEIGNNRITRKSIAGELYEVERYARLTAAVEQSSRARFQEALRARETAKDSSAKFVYIAFHRMLFYWYAGISRFRHYGLNLDRALRAIRKGETPGYLPEMLDDLELSVELLDKAFRQIYAFNHIIWPIEKGHQVFRIRRKHNGSRRSGDVAG